MAGRLATWCCSALLACALAIQQASAATVLSEADAHLLQLLQPAARSALPGWLDAHERLADEVAAAAAAGDGVPLVLYGDSIFESCRGTSMGYDAADEYGDNAAAWRQRAPPRALIAAISGDQTTHLLWRLQNGEGPRGLAPARIGLMIGTNDLGHLGFRPEANASSVGHVVSLGVQQVVRELQRQAPQATITVFGLLPFQPAMMGRPARSFDGMVEAANEELGRYVAAEASPRLRYKKDCGARFLLADGAVDPELMPDGVHPAGPGGKQLVDCVLGGLAA